VLGKISEAVQFPDGSRRRIYGLDSTGNWLEDFGFGQLTDGSAQVAFDDSFSAVVDGDSYHVFLTEYEDNHALYVANRQKNGFIVKAKSAAVTGSFSYRVVAKRKEVAAQRFETVSLPPARLQPATGGSVVCEPVPAG
jgi:hypothetical protein